MNYQELIDSDGNKHIIVDLGDGAFKSFPADESNPEFVAWLETADGKAYLEGAK